MVNSSPGAWPCGCGRTGCMESYAGANGLLRRYSELGGVASSIHEIAQSTNDASDVVFCQLGEALGTGLAIINNVLDLDAIVFTGGVANSFSRFEGYLRSALCSRAFAPPLAEIALEISRLGENAGVIGAAHLLQARVDGALLAVADRDQ